MHLIRAQQSEAQFFFKTALQELEVLMTHGNSVAIHNEFLLSLWAMIRSLNGRSEPSERTLLSRNLNSRNSTLWRLLLFD